MTAEVRARSDAADGNEAHLFHAFIELVVLGAEERGAHSHHGLRGRRDERALISTAHFEGEPPRPYGALRCKLQGNAMTEHFESTSGPYAPD